MMTTNLCVIANVKQLRTGGSFEIVVSFFQTSLDVVVLNSAIFNSFHDRDVYGTILEGLRNFVGGDSNPPNPPIPRYATGGIWDNYSKMYLRQDIQTNTRVFCHRQGTSCWQLSTQQWSLGIQTYPWGTSILSSKNQLRGITWTKRSPPP
jgi:hypothetical protein